MKIRSLQIFMVVIIALMLIAPIALSASDEDGEENNVAKMSSTKVKNVFELKSCGKLNIENGYYRLVKDVRSKGTCFKIMANNITLDGQGHNVKYAKRNKGRGVLVSSKKSIMLSYINIYNLSLTSGTKDKISVGVEMINIINSNLYDNVFLLQGAFSEGILAYTGGELYDSNRFSSNITIANNIITSTDKISKGIRISSGRNFTIFSNLIVMAGNFSEGIILSGSKFNSVINNDISLINGSAYNHIYLTNPEDNFLFNNTFRYI